MTAGSREVWRRARARFSLVAALLIQSLVLLALAACAGGEVVAPADERPEAGGAPSATVGSGREVDFRSRVLDYPGPEDSEAAAGALEEVSIGWFGPSDPADPLTGGLWTAAALAVEQANADGGYRGAPFRLIPAWSDSPWANGAARVMGLAYEHRVVAIVGSIDGPATHVAEQVVAKARLALVSPVSTDKSVNLAGVPWMFSCAPGDHLYAALLVEDLLSSLATAGDEFVVLRCTDHDSRLAAVELLREIGQRDRAPALALDFHPGEAVFADVLRALDDVRPRAVLLVAGPEDAARAVTALQMHGVTARVFAPPTAGRDRFRELAGEAGDGVRFPKLWETTEAAAELAEFRREFGRRAGVEPDYAAAFSYDAVRLVIAAVRQAGTGRARIRSALAALSPWSGVSGSVRWDGTGQNARPVTRMATIRHGRVWADSARD